MDCRLVERWRADTPGCRNRVHLNNAGAGLMPTAVAEAMRRHLEREAEVGGYEAADAAASVIEEAYGSVAGLIGAAPRNIAIVENATVAVAQALSAFDLRDDATIVTSRADYSSNQLMFLSLARRFGVRVRRAEDLPEGGVDPQSVREILRQEDCRLVVLSWIPTNSGLTQAAAEVGGVCREAGVPYVVDACQAVGTLPVDVRALQCDFLAATARKFLRGPRGIGFLYVSDGILREGRHPVYIDTRGAKWSEADAFRLEPDARRFENWEFAYALVLGLGAAARYAQDAGIDRCGRRARELAAYARDALAELDGVRVLDRGVERAPIVTASVGGVDAGALVRELRRRRINTSAAVREHAVIDMDAKGVASALRLSPHYYNTGEEIDRAVDAIRELVR
ncbi:MAG: aminotransferase class V-fold PLP-dependent enzyme [Gemmatimonadota bacterium]